MFLLKGFFLIAVLEYLFLVFISGNHLKINENIPINKNINQKIVFRKLKNPTYEIGVVGYFKKARLILILYLCPYSLTDKMLRCGRSDRGSIPRRGNYPKSTL